MSSTVKLLLLVLINRLDAKTVYRMNKMLIDTLDEMAKKTGTDLDDKLVEIVRKFIKLEDEVDMG